MRFFSKRRVTGNGLVGLFAFDDPQAPEIVKRLAKHDNADSLRPLQVAMQEIESAVAPDLVDAVEVFDFGFAGDLPLSE